MKQQTFTAILCDDEASILAELRETVNWSQLNTTIVDTASNGREAVEKIIKHKPDLVIMDIQMPEGSGLDTISAVRNAGVNADFIILSGFNDFQYAQRAIRYNAKSYLLKPLNIEELTNEIYRILGQRAKNEGGRLNTALKKQMDASFFRSILDGRLPESAVLHSMLENTDHALRDAENYVMIFSFPPDSAPDLEALSAKLNDTLTKIPHFFFPYKNALTGILNASSSLPQQLAEELLLLLKEENLEPLVGIGDTVSTLMQCQYSYSRALTALSYRLYGKNRRIFPASIICTAPPQLQLSDIECLPLIQHMIKLDRAAIKSFCVSFVEQLQYVLMPPPNYVFSTCYTLMHKVEEEFSQYSNEEISEISSPHALYRCQSLDEITEFLCTSFTNLAEYIDAVYGYAEKNETVSESSISSDDEIINTALTYIREHIANHLKINDIANEVHLSPSYFAIYFKNKVSVCLRDYLQQEKMEYARRSLVNPDVSINEVAYMLGYRDYRSFSRAFKRIHGLTPSEFQNKYRH